MLTGLGDDSFGSFATQCRAVTQTQGQGCGFQEFVDSALTCSGVMNADAQIPAGFCRSQCYSDVAPFLDACTGSMDPTVEAMLNAGKLRQAVGGCQQITVTHVGGSGQAGQLCTSGVSCADLAAAHGGWAINSGHDAGANAAAESQSVCGESDNGLAGGCTTSNGWEHANQICTDVGARLCTVTELGQGEVRGSGCGFDRERTWTSNVANCPRGSHMSARGTGNDDVYCECSNGLGLTVANSDVDRCCEQATVCVRPATIRATRTAATTECLALTATVAPP